MYVKINRLLVNCDSVKKFRVERVSISIANKSGLALFIYYDDGTKDIIAEDGSFCAITCLRDVSAALSALDCG